jgi:TolB-like protein
VALIFLLTAGGAVYYLVFIQGKATQSVAVLAFDAPEGEFGLQRLADRLTTDVASQMTNIPKLKVANPSDVAKLKGEVEPREAGRKLGVRAVLKGTLSRKNDVLYLNVELIEVETGSLLWRPNHPYEVAEKAAEGQMGRWTGEIAKEVKNHLFK